MFARIKSALTRKPGLSEDWNALRSAGYPDTPRHFDRTDGWGLHAQDPRNRFEWLGHLR